MIKIKKSLILFLILLMVSLVFAVVNQPTLNSPSNQTFTNDNTPDFNFTITGNWTSYSCELFLNDTGYGTNTSVLNDTATIITANDTVSDSFYNWYINCTNSTTNQSEVRDITIDTTAPNNLSVGNNDTTIKVNDVVLFYAQWSDSLTGLNYSIFSWNYSGSWANDSAVILTEWSNVTKTIALTGKPQIDWKIYANDTVGNWNDTGTQTFTMSNTAPTQPSLTNPANNSYLNSVTLNWTASTDADLDSITYYVLLNGIQICYTANLNCSNVTTNNYYEWNVTAFDGTVNGTTSASRYFTYDTTNPRIAFDTGTLANNSYRNQTFIYANWTFTEINLMNITARLYNSTKHLINATTFLTATYSINFTRLTDGVYYFNVSSYDNATNYNQTETRLITLDNTAPSITLLSPGNNSILSSSDIILSYNVSEVNTIDNCTLNYRGTAGISDTNINKSATNTFSVYENQQGPDYTWLVKCYDNSGNVGTSLTNSFSVAWSEEGDDTSGGGATEVASREAEAEYNATTLKAKVEIPENIKDNLILRIGWEIFPSNPLGGFFFLCGILILGAYAFGVTPELWKIFLWNNSRKNQK